MGARSSKCRTGSQIISMITVRLLTERNDYRLTGRRSDGNRRPTGRRSDCEVSEYLCTYSPKRPNVLCLSGIFHTLHQHGLREGLDNVALALAMANDQVSRPLCG